MPSISANRYSYVLSSRLVIVDEWAVAPTTCSGEGFDGEAFCGSGGDGCSVACE